jgi:hypothetical protein
LKEKCFSSGIHNHARKVTVILQLPLDQVHGHPTSAMKGLIRYVYKEKLEAKEFYLNTLIKGIAAARTPAINSYA